MFDHCQDSGNTPSHPRTKDHRSHARPEDTQASALEVDEKLLGKETGHHKFKVSFPGCPIDCFKSYLNDVGFQGVVYPQLAMEACISCGLCAKSCKAGAIQMRGDGKPVSLRRTASIAEIASKPARPMPGPRPGGDISCA